MGIKGEVQPTTDGNIAVWLFDDDKSYILYLDRLNAQALSQALSLGVATLDIRNSFDLIGLDAS